MSKLTLTAKWILPIDQPPIENGSVTVDGAKIVAVGQKSDLVSGEVMNLGDAIVMPGFVNVHSHLEYTMLRGFLEDVDFFPWIRTLTAAKSHYSRDDWADSAALGALECLAAGITTIGDNTDAGVTAQVASETGLRARVYQEIFGIDHRDSVDAAISALDTKLSAMSAFASDTVELGVSPHALYTVRPELFTAINRFCEANSFRTSIHVAESPAESELTEQGSGPFAAMFARRQIVWQVPHVSPTRYLHDLGALNSSALAVHCVHQNESDIELMAKSGVTIAHCVKSNGKLGAGIAPLAAWTDDERLSGRIGLGTDSAVSNNTLDMFEEMRFAILTQRAENQAIVLSARQMVEMATIGGATALGWENKIGSITPGKQADLTAVKLDSLHSSPSTDPYAALVYASRADDVCLTMVNGRILYQNGTFLQSDSVAIRNRAVELRYRIVDIKIGMA